MKMRADDEIVDFDILRPEESGLTAGGGASSETDAPERFVLAITENGYGKRVRASEFRVQVRAARAKRYFVAISLLNRCRRTRRNVAEWA